jgi:type VI secretion system secreted protein Hcp
MAVDMFLELDGIKGETKDGKFASKGAIDVLSFSWGCSQTGTFGAGGGGGAGKVAYSYLNIMMNVCKASAQLMQRCATGDHIAKGTLTVRKAGKEQQEFYTVKLTDLLVSSYQTSGASEVPTDSISLNFAKIEFEYKPQKPDGSLDGPVYGKWNISENKTW